MRGAVLVDVLEQGHTVSSAFDVETLKKLRYRLQERPEKKQILFFSSITVPWPHTILKYFFALINIECVVLQVHVLM
jgi:hypothetical protein